MKRPLLSVLALSTALATTAGPLLPAFASQEEEALRRDLEARLARAELLAGLTSVEGPGLVVTLRNSPRMAPRGVDRKALQVQEQDFNAILNVIRAAGADAIAIGGSNTPTLERVTNVTAARAGWNGLVIHGITLHAPFRILAIGEAARLKVELMREGGVVRKAGLDVLEMIELEEVSEVTLPAARTVSEFKFARASSGEPTTFAENPPPRPRPEPRVTKPVAAEQDGEEPKITGIVRRTPVKTAQALPLTPAPLPQPPVRTLPEPTPNTVPPVEKPPVAEKPAPRPPAVEKPIEKPVEKPAAEKPSAKPAPKGAIFGGRGLAKFHVAGCRYGERIEASDRVSFSSVKDAVQKGRSACPVCQPR